MNPEEILSLVKARSPESQRLEFKRDLPSNNKEFAADVCAMANASGGSILLGISSQSGCAVSVVGVESADIDAEVLRLTQIIRSGIEPSLKSVRIEQRIVEGKSVLEIEIPPSFSRPHWVTLDRQFRFHIRHNSGKDRMSLDEIRDAFLQSGSVLDRATEWRRARAAALNGTEGRLQLHTGTIWMALHICPLSAFSATGPRFDPQPQFKSAENELRTMFDHGGGRPNYLGWKLEAYDRDTRTVADRVQVYRDFRIEVVFRAGEKLNDTDDRSTLWAGVNERYIEDWFRRFARWGDEHGMPYPAYVFVTLINAGGSVISGRYSREQRATANLMLLDPASLEAGAHPMNALKLTFDHLYQSYEMASSPYYDATGAWVRRKG